MISFFDEGVVSKLKQKRLLKTWIKEVVDSYGYSVGEISYIFCSEDYILDINRKYLCHDYFTDIITFDYTEGDVISGDLFISIDTVKSNAEILEVDFIDELHRVIIHGILHLCGFKDKTLKEETEMRAAEDSALRLLEYISNFK